MKSVSQPSLFDNELPLEDTKIVVPPIKCQGIKTKLVPFMTIIYILVTIIIIIKNINILPVVFIRILKNAFNFKSFLSSFIPTVIIGLQRGIFSSEAGLGTCSIRIR